MRSPYRGTGGSDWMMRQGLAGGRAALLAVFFLVVVVPTAFAATAPVNTQRPTVGGAQQVEATLTAEPGVWSADPAVNPATGFSYQWQRCETGTASFQPTGSMTGPRASGLTERLEDGTVLITGGYPTSFDTTGTSETYDPDTGTFIAAGSMSTPRVLAVSARLDDGTVLVSGGLGGLGAAGFTAEIYDPDARTFSPTGSPVETRYMATATKLPDGKVLVAGGSGPGESRASAELYNPSAGTFSLTDSMNFPRASAVAVALDDGRVLVAGGQAGGLWLNTAEIYDPDTGTFTTTGTMTEARGYPSAVRLPDGRVLFVGGYGYGPGGPPESTQLASAEIFDPESGTFTATGSIPTPIYENAIELLEDGRVLVAGGFSPNGAIDSTSIYNPVAGSFIAGPTMASTNANAQSTSLEDGRVLIAGGTAAGDGLLASAVLFVPGALDCSDIPGANSSQYVLQPADFGKRIRAQVTASNGVGSDGVALSLPTGYITGSSPGTSADPTIDGDAEVGKTLTADPKTWSGYPTPSITYQWQRCPAPDGDCDPITDATAMTYVPTGADLGSRLRVRVIGTNEFGSNFATSNRTGPVFGTPRIGRVLVTGPGKVRRGRTVAYRVSIGNSGTAPATGVRLRVSGGGIRFNAPVGSIAAGASKSVLVKARLRRLGRLTATFLVSSGNAGTGTAKKVIRVVR